MNLTTRWRAKKPSIMIPGEALVSTFQKSYLTFLPHFGKCKNSNPKSSSQTFNEAGAWNI